jgi:hypothetical protein
MDFADAHPAEYNQPTAQSTAGTGKAGSCILLLSHSRPDSGQNLAHLHGHSPPSIRSTCHTRSKGKHGSGRVRPVVPKKQPGSPCCKQGRQGSQGGVPSNTPSVKRNKARPVLAAPCPCTRPRPSLLPRQPEWQIKNSTPRVCLSSINLDCCATRPFLWHTVKPS